MNPRLSLTAVPYAFQAGQLAQFNGTTNFTSNLTLAAPTGGNQTFVVQDQGAAGTYNLLTQTQANSNYLQFAPATVQADASTRTTININKTSFAPIIEFSYQSVAVWSVDAFGRTTIRPSTDNGTAFRVSSRTTNIDVLSVDTTTEQVQVRNLVSTSGITTGGALVFTGTSGTSNFVTPLGGTVQTKINIPLQNPGNFGQLLALGVPSTASATARVINVFDARAAGHQPSIAVTSPDQNQIFGLSYDGSNTTGYLMNSAASIRLQAGASNILTATRDSSTLGTVTIGVGGTNAGRLELANATNSFGVYLQAGVTAASYALQLPTAIGGAGQCLTIASVASTTAQLGYSTCNTAPGVSLQASTPGTADTGNFNISGRGIAATLQGTTSVQTSLLDTVGATTLNIGTTNATQINLGSAVINTSVLGNLGVGTTATNRFNVNTPTTAVTGADAVITASSATNVGLVIQTAPSATSNAFQVRSSAGGVQAGITGSGRIFAASTAPVGNAVLSASTGSASNSGIGILGSAGQTANLIDLKDVNSNVNASFGPLGNQLTLGRIAASGTVTQGQIVLSDGTTSNFGITLQSAALTASRTIILPNESGTILTDTSGVKLQGFTPGTAQSGSLNISGTAIAGTLQAGTTTNGVSLSATGVVLTGTARNAQTILLTAEYAGAVLDASGTNNTGSMTSGFNMTNRMNYYKWTTAQTGASQSYDVVTQVPIPSDFSAWSGGGEPSISVSTYTTNTTNSKLSIGVLDTTGAATSCVADGGTPTFITPGSTSTWTTMTPSCGTGGTYTAGGYITLRVRMTAQSGSVAQVGNITLNYLSKY
jgi:hypothetical protein